jgi:hypothetical protein
VLEVIGRVDEVEVLFDLSFVDDFNALPSADLLFLLLSVSLLVVKVGLQLPSFVELVEV